MYLQRPVQALRAIRNALNTRGALVSAVWINPGQASFFELPRATLARITKLPPIKHDGPGTFYYSDLDRLTEDLEAAGFKVKHSEILEVGEIEVTSGDELIAWARAFGMSKLLQGIPSSQQSAWERELIAAAEQYRTREGNIRLGGSSRLIVAA